MFAALARQYSPVPVPKKASDPEHTTATPAGSPVQVTSLRLLLKFTATIVQVPIEVNATPVELCFVVPAASSFAAGLIVQIPTCPRVRYMSLDAMAHDC